MQVNAVISGWYLSALTRKIIGAVAIVRITLKDGSFRESLGHGEKSSNTKMSAISVAQTNAVENAMLNAFLLFTGSARDNIESSLSVSTKRPQELDADMVCNDVKKGRVAELNSSTERMSESNTCNTTIIYTKDNNISSLPLSLETESKPSLHHSQQISSITNSNNMSGVPPHIHLPSGVSNTFPKPISLKGQKYPPNTSESFPATIYPPRSGSGIGTATAIIPPPLFTGNHIYNNSNNSNNISTNNSSSSSGYSNKSKDTSNTSTTIIYNSSINPVPQERYPPKSYTSSSQPVALPSSKGTVYPPPK
jgi:hypothetical protein